MRTLLFATIAAAALVFTSACNDHSGTSSNPPTPNMSAAPMASMAMSSAGSGTMTAGTAGSATMASPAAIPTAKVKPTVLKPKGKHK